MLDKLVLATGNRDKVKEITKLLDGLAIQILPLSDFRDAPEVIEDGRTLEENAVKKAQEIAQFTGLPALADDTGLEVDYLDGKPGVYSSRFAGENATYADNVKKLLREMDGVPFEQRQARFKCVVAFHHENRIRTTEGVCEGVIISEPRGEDGFGYDPVFYVPEYQKTFAEMQLAVKNRMSHRAKAFLKMRQILTTYLQKSGRSAAR